MKSLPEISPALIKGVLAYSEGREEEALKTLRDIDHRAFDSRMGGDLALAKAMVAAKDDTASALGYLDDARLLCPGTLVEEAALRREVLLLAKAQDYPRFETLSFQYLRRFPKSVYAKSFSRSFAIAIASGSFGAEPQFMSQLERRLDELPDETRKQLYMTLAEEGVIRGRVELTRLAVDKIASLVKAGSREATRLQLYKAASLVVTNEYESASATLRGIDRSKLDSSDAQLLDGALALAKEMRAPPQIASPIAEPPPLSSAAQVKHGAVAEKSEALDRARQALGQADALLNRTTP
jgi:chemotaxis protein MotC